MLIVDRAISLGCHKVQLFKPHFNQEMIDKAHAHGITCNIFWSDDPEEAKAFLAMGIDELSVSPSAVLPLRAEIRKSIAQTCTLDMLEC
jgi:phosphoenolpyruvate-protein kinase (PTS system EI component)